MHKRSVDIPNEAVILEMHASVFACLYYAVSTHYAVIPVGSPAAFSLLHAHRSFPPTFIAMKPLAFISTVIVCLLVAATADAQIRKGRRNEPPVDDGRPPQATPIDQIKVKKDFRVELLYSVQRGQGSWVSMCLDSKGRLIVSDQGTQGL